MRCFHGHLREIEDIQSVVGLDFDPVIVPNPTGSDAIFADGGIADHPLPVQ